jgi:hypothetical protein
MLRCNRASVAAVSVFLLGSFGFAPSAFAGFQWVSPPAEVSGSNVVVPTIAPVPPMGMNTPAVTIVGSGGSVNNVQSAPTSLLSNEITSPVVITGRPVNAQPVVNRGAYEQSPSTPLTINDNSQPVLVPVPDVKPTENFKAADTDIVHGFAKAVPVVVALRQILPSGYAFSIDPNIDMGTLVSFQGGRGWRETLHSAFVSVGLEFQERGQMVEVTYAGDAHVSARQAIAVPYQSGAEPRTLALPPSAMIAPASSVTVNETSMIPPMASQPTNITTMGSDIGGADLAEQTWTAERGASLHKILGEWAQRAHVEMNWLAEYDYPIDASVSYTGSFKDAVRNILAGFETAHPQPVAELHNNAALGQMVLIIQVRGNTGTD